MKLVSIVIRGLIRRPLQTGLSIFTCALVAFLITALLSVPASIKRITSDAAGRLRVIVSAPNAYMLPVWYCSAIRKMPGVAAAAGELEWSAIYRDPREPIIAFGVDLDIVNVYPEGHLTAEEIQALERDHRAVEVGSLLMKRYNWHLGKPLTLKNADGKIALTFIPVVVLQAKRDQNAFVFRRELLDQAVKHAFNVDIADRATFIAVRVDSLADVPRVIDEIDSRFHNSEYETSTLTESDSIANGLSAIADLSTIVFALCAVICVTLLLIAANAIAMNIRDRVSEVGVFRALGFRQGQVAMILFGEAAVVAILGGSAGGLLAYGLFGGGVTLGAVLGGQGYMQVTPDAAVASLAGVVVVILLSAIVPVLQSLAISPAVAFRKVV